MFFSLNLKQPYKTHVVFSTSHSQHYFIQRELTIQYVAVTPVAKKIVLCSVRTESLQAGEMAQPAKARFTTKNISRTGSP